MRSPARACWSARLTSSCARQIDYGDQLGVPWGISESAYNARDIELTYQYSQFGVPGLGIVRGLADDVVVAPYATGLAAMVMPAAAAANYRALAPSAPGADSGSTRRSTSPAPGCAMTRRYAIVRCYMAHHQGMTIVGIHNVVHGG